MTLTKVSDKTIRIYDVDVKTYGIIRFTFELDNTTNTEQFTKVEFIGGDLVNKDTGNTSVLETDDFEFLKAVFIALKEVAVQRKINL